MFCMVLDSGDASLQIAGQHSLDGHTQVLLNGYDVESAVDDVLGCSGKSA